ncbi:MAG: beta strand repeat-containing protein [Acidimicrobiales bacterium]
MKGSRSARALVALTTATVAAQVVLGLSPAAAATPAQVTDSFGFDGGTLQSFTVPADVNSLSVTLMGGQGSWGGADSSGNPPAGGYQGEVTGTISVTPGNYLTIAVGSGGDAPYHTDCTTGQDASSPSDIYDAVGGENPLSQYDGGDGGAPGPNGCSGYGGSGGAATVVEVDASQPSPTNIGTILAGGGGGDGGSGQYVLVRGQVGLSYYVPQSAPTATTYGIPAGCSSSVCTSYHTIDSPSPLPASPSRGQVGTAVFTMCGGSTNANNADQYFNTGAPDDEAGCDGGGGAGGGGGAAGGSAGSVQFGSGSSDEWYGQGGSPGDNSTGNFPGLTAFYSYYSDYDSGTPSGTSTFADPGASFDGSVVITYATGIPSVPTDVTGTNGNGSVALQWSAPAPDEASPISDYVIRYSSNGGSSWGTYDTGSAATSVTVGGLSNGTAYIFEVQAVNSVGSGSFSSPSSTFTPSGPPGPPTITSITPQDGGLVVNFTASSSGAPISGYLYQLNGSGPWLASSATSSPLTISGLADGTSYSVQIEAQSSIGTGPPSNSLSQTPLTSPGPPTIASVQVGPGAASVDFTPGNTGGGAITGYRYSTDGAVTWTLTSVASPLSLSGLANGTTFNFELEAVNSSGVGSAATTSFTTPSVPSAPAISSITPGSQQLTVRLSPPSSGGYPVTDYQWSTDGGTTWYSEDDHITPCQRLTATAGTVMCQISALSSDGSTALTNGTLYSVEMRAVNAVGTGAASQAVPATPYTVPSPPTITTSAGGMVAADQSLTVSFAPPANDGGSTITGYQYSTDAGSTWQPADGGQPLTSNAMTITTLSADGVTSLSNGTTYDVEIRAANAAGPGVASGVAAGIPSTAPDAAVIDSVTPGDGTLAVAFTAGANNGAVISGYKYSIDGGNTWAPTGSLSPEFIVPGLTNGTSYQVQVISVNANGSSPASAPLAGAPATEPSQPVITATARGNASIDVTYSEGPTGGSPVTSYQYSTDGGTTWYTASPVGNPLVLTALSTNGISPVVNGTSYPVEIRAVNAVGASVASAPINVAPAAAPSAPDVTLTPADGLISVSLSVPNNGGSPVTRIDYSLNGGTFASSGTAGSSFTVPGLTNGTAYAVSVRADNAIGDGAASSPHDATPSTVPGAPTSVVATSGSASVAVAWSAPTSDGGSAVTGYSAAAYTTLSETTVAGTPCITLTLACTITDLTNGTTYYVGVIASNTNGSSVSSSPLQVVTPIARPDAPALTGVTAGDSYLSLAFVAGSAGGDPVTAYQYSLDGGNTWATASGTTSPIVVSGLVNGTTYTAALRAVSAAGAGANSNTMAGRPYTYPGVVDASTITVNGEDAQAVLSWTVPSDGGSAITEAQATAFSSRTGGAQEGTCTTSTNLAVGATASCTMSGLGNGTTYYVSVQSENVAGWSGRSSPRVAVIPSVTPGQVQDLNAAPGDGEALLSWQEGSTGGAPITTYTVWYSSGGAYTQFDNGSSTATSATVTGLVNGTPYTFEVYAINSYGSGPASAASNQVTPEGPSITSPVLGNGEVNVPYSATLTASGPSGPFTWSISAGTLPAGLLLSSATGSVIGTPTATGAANFTVEATDTVGGTASQTERVVIAAAPTISSPPFGDGEVTIAYYATPAFSGGTGPYSWSISSGSLPSGVNLVPGTGALSGTPTATGTKQFTLQVMDSLGAVATQAESVHVLPALGITPPTGYRGVVGVAYSVTLSPSGGEGPFTWSISNGSLPSGLALSAPTGEMSGTPTTSGTANFTVRVTDSLGGTASQAVTATILPPVIVTPTTTTSTVPVPPVVVSPPATTSGPSPAPSTPQFEVNVSQPSNVVAGGSFDLVVSPSLGASGAAAANAPVLSVQLPGGETFAGAPNGHEWSCKLSANGTSSTCEWAGTLPASPGSALGELVSDVQVAPGAHGVGKTIVTLSDAAEGAISSSASAPVIFSSSGSAGYRLVGSDGGVYDFKTPFYGSCEVNGTRCDKLDRHVDGIASTPDGRGYWLVARDGGVFAFGDARFYGSCQQSAHPCGKVVGAVVAIAPTPDGKGYWLAAANGVVYRFGDAASYGSCASPNHPCGTLSSPVIGIAASSRGGYWMATAKGNVLGFGKGAPVLGTCLTKSSRCDHLEGGVVGITSTPGSRGYWLVAADGGVFTFGNAHFYGNTRTANVESQLAGQLVGMTRTPDGKGYWLVASDGGVFAFGEACFWGNTRTAHVEPELVGRVMGIAYSSEP